ncbi:carboxyl ester lipase, tandem duplicate 2 [Trematomus bernacchii]|uniref:carboxyl ester lipase, tandem duplicate 2 n=1 Tax=Trematomus bernacchii TaxID=40690 RepID=UPI00146DA7B2|nr:carboxyl ester lipase, tandem duplicate 2 [Trematomus bernacchii]
MLKLGILVAVAVFLETVSATSLGVVYTDGGKVQGKNIRLGFRRHMDVFRGIPFADIPGRFEKPKRHPGWDGVLKATEYRNRCIQVNLLMTDTRGSEDCLFLNIWVPHGRSVSTGLPVMIWIFGGGFLVGGSMGANFLENYLYSGQEIADRGDVIVVTINYRVGALGFLSTGESDLPGNYGLWDQHTAIAWVNRNIRSFGGDPDKITVFGESAGGASVNFQTLTPHNKGLFKRAISQSGVALCPWAINKNPRRFAEEVAIKVNCPTDERMAPCLKMTDPAVLTLAGSLSISSSPDQPLVFNLALSPVIDGDFIPDDPSKLFNNTADIDYIAGVNNMDGHLFTGLDVPTINSPLVNTPIEDVKRLLTAYTKDKGKAGADNAYSTYTSNWGSNPSWETIKKTVVEIGTDYIFLVPIQAALYLHAANAKTGRTYSYLFSEPSRMGGIARPYPSWMGADHADDLQYVFGKPFSSPLGYWPRHRDVSGYIIAYWTNFAKTGDPNKGGQRVPTPWPQFTSTGHQYVEIHHDMNKAYVREKMRMRHVHFWTSVLPNLPISASE